MPRVTYSKGRFNSTNYSEFYPGIASSPLNEDKNLNEAEVEQHLQEHELNIQKVEDENKTEILKLSNEAFEEFDQAIEECLSKGSFDFPVTLETLKIARSMFMRNKIAGLTEKEDQTHQAFYDAANKQEALDSDGAVKNGGRKKNITNCSTADSEPNKGKRDEQKTEEEPDGVFKKPAEITRKTRKTSRAISKEYQTPKRTGYNKSYNIAKVTPGPDIDRPLSVLRRPVPGEMAVSMNGSPLVTTHDNISVPQMTIPLSNGRVLTYLANEGLDPDESICGEIDQETQERLNVFYKLLEKKIKKRKGC